MGQYGMGHREVLDSGRCGTEQGVWNRNESGNRDVGRRKVRTQVCVGYIKKWYRARCGTLSGVGQRNLGQKWGHGKIWTQGGVDTSGICDT